LNDTRLPRDLLRPRDLERLALTRIGEDGSGEDGGRVPEEYEGSTV
jgi:hypothetical protein